MKQAGVVAIGKGAQVHVAHRHVAFSVPPQNNDTRTKILAASSASNAASILGRSAIRVMTVTVFPEAHIWLQVQLVRNLAEEDFDRKLNFRTAVNTFD